MRRIALFIELLKPRILTMQLVTFAMGFFLADPIVFDLNRFVFGLLGTALTAGGAGVLNHCMEADVDRYMKRTQHRPLPSGKMSVLEATAFGLLVLFFGLAIIYIKVNFLTALLSFATVFLYLLVYTPMKQLSWFNTLVGAVPGALPPLGGWAAATGSVAPGAYYLFAILFVWQLPHFYAIAWIHCDDYRRAGFKMLSVMDPDGDRSARQIVLQTILLIAVSLMPVVNGMMGIIYAIGAIFLGIYFLKPGLLFRRTRKVQDARKVLFASVIYLPLLLILIVIDSFLFFR